LKKKLFFILFLFLLLVAYGTIFFLKKKNFVVVHPRIGPMTEAIYGLGKVKSRRTFQVVVGVLLTVQKIFVHEGDVVNKGEPLIKFESGTVTAPFKGTVTLVKFEEGETVLPQVPILRVENMEDRYLEISVEQQSALKIKKGQKAKISFESLRGEILEGRVRTIFSREDEFLTHIEVSGMDSSILPGMTADVSIEIGKNDHALLIPVSAISNGMVAFRKDGKWVKEKVHVGHVDGLYAEILNSKLTPKSEIRLKRN
jgi:macrolide-specific efflux system membrane fusion protein